MNIVQWPTFTLVAAIRAAIRAAFTATLAATLTAMLLACGGATATTPPPPAAGTLDVGPAGGTVAGPDGAQVVVPAGALSTAVTIEVRKAAAGAPALPSGTTALGPTYEFLPHGLAFALPVTIKVPFDPALLPGAGATPTLYKTDAALAGYQALPAAAVDGAAMTAPVSGFSFAQVALPPAAAPLSAPWREWEFALVTLAEAPDVGHTSLAQGAQFGGTLERQQTFGGVESFHDILFGNANHVADGNIFSTPDGAVYGIDAESPYNPGTGLALGTPVGGYARFTQSQRFRKVREGASFGFVISRVELIASDHTEAPPACHPPAPCERDLLTQVLFSLRVEVPAARPEDPPRELVRQTAWGTASGYRAGWGDEFTAVGAGPLAVWTADKFDITHDETGDGSQVHFYAKLREPLRVTLDLSSIPVGGDFDLRIEVKAHAVDGRQRESYALAAFRDPRDPTGGIQLEVDGLEPVALDPVFAAARWNGPGQITLLRSAFAAPESTGAAWVWVHRLDGRPGEVSVHLRTADGTARAGADYGALDQVVTFADGDDLPRLVRVPLTWDAETEAAETLTVTLSEPSGGARLGAVTTAQITIDDVPQVGVQTYSVGGTVNGLAGSGLVLGGPGFSNLMPGADGPFTFAERLLDTVPYDVRVLAQPTNPAQVCTVSSGAGTIAGADVTGIRVDCALLAANGALDASFGAGGKVFDASIPTGANAVALQSTGRILVLANATLARYLADGSLDASFGTGGKVTIGFRTVSGTEALGLTVQADDKILVTGAARVGSFNQMALARYLADGAPDLAFGTGGLVTVDPYAVLGTGANQVARQALVLADGKIVLIGHAGVREGSIKNDFAIARFNADGTPDATFNGGLASSTVRIGATNNFAYAAGVQSTGKVVLAGAVSNTVSIGEDGVGLARWKADGHIDRDDPPIASNFGDAYAGYSVFDPGVLLGSGRGGVTADVDLAMLADDSFVVATSAWAPVFPLGTARRIVLVRVGARGQVCCLGSIASAVVGTGDDLLHAMTRQADGKFVVVAEVVPPGGGTVNSDFAVVRFNA
ncbi:MAG: Calx-beta domain-containing protein, partial [Rubrivivax sp.]